MVESGKPKSASSAHKISVAADVNKKKSASKDGLSDGMLDDLMELDDVKSSSDVSAQDTDTKAEDSEAPAILEAAPPLGAHDAPVEESEHRPISAKSASAETKSSANPRPVRTTDGFVSGPVRRNNLTPIAKRPLGVPPAERGLPQTVTAPKFRAVDDDDEDEDKATFNPLLTAFWTKQRLVVGAVVVVLLIVGVGAAFVLKDKFTAREDDETVDEDVEEDNLPSAIVDYNQTITTADGQKFDNNTPVYHKGSDDLVVLFSDLTCQDSTCSNVSNAKIGSTSLVRGTDYTVESQKDGLLLTIKSTVLNGKNAGSYVFIFENTVDGVTTRIGLKFKIEAEEEKEAEEETTQAPAASSTNKKPATGTSNAGTSSSSKPSGSNTGSSSNGSGTTGGSNNNGGNTGNGGNSQGGGANDGTGGNNTGGNNGGGSTEPGEGEGNGDEDEEDEDDATGGEDEN